MRFPSSPSLLGVLIVVSLAACGKPAPATAPKAAAMSVTAAAPVEKDVAPRIRVYGAIHPWQESSVGVEVSGLRIKDLLVETGESVVRGQLMARLNDESVQADVAVQRAALQDAEAAASQATANADRARRLKEDDAVSEQDFLLAVTTEKSARAKVAMIKAQLDAQLVRLRNTKIVAPDAGVISARTGSVGQVVSAGTELFKLIRQHRLEWRAEVPADQLGQLAIGDTAYIRQTSGEVHTGTVRQIAPSLDSTTKTGLVYVDLMRDSELKAGNYIQGEFQLVAAKALTIPAASVLRRDGRKYVLVVDDQSAAHLREVEVGSSAGNDVVVSKGLKPTDKVLTTGMDFISDGDKVQVVADVAERGAA